MVPGGGLVAPLRGSLGVEDDVKIVVVEDSGGVGDVVSRSGPVSVVKGRLGVKEDVEVVVVKLDVDVGDKADALFLCLDFYWWFIFARIGK